MTTVGIADFSGMMPLRDPILLPDNYSQFSRNTWLYRGAIRGYRVSPIVYTLKRPFTSKQVYRIPLNDNLTDWVNSLWLEFPDPYMSVIRNPTVGDQFDRYYFFPSSEFVDDGSGWFSVPFYAPLANLIAGGPYFILGIPVPTIAPVVVPPAPSAILVTNAPTVPGSEILNFASTAGVSNGMEVSDISNTVITLNTTADAAIGANLLGFTDTTGIVAGMLVYDTTNPSAINNLSVLSVGSTYVLLSGSITAPGVITDDAIQFSNINVITAGTTVISVTPTTVTLSAPALHGGVLTGDVITFNTVAETRAYLYTYVSSFNEEGAPSPATVLSGNPTGTWAITVYSPSNVQSANKSLAYVNIYRSVTDSSGSSTFFQVAEKLPITSPSAPILFEDSLTDGQIANNLILATTVNTGPPIGLDNVVWMANGILAGSANEREIWFSTAFQPWAWPATFALTVDFPVVGMSAIGSMLNILTEGQPFIAAGTTPDTMTIGKITANEPCVSRGSIFPAGEGVYYASPNGLILLNTNGTINTTQFAMEREFWQSLSPEQWASGRLGLSYTAFIKGSMDTDDPNGLVLDHLEKNVPCSLLQVLIESGETLENLYWDMTSGQLFMIHGGIAGAGVRWWMPPATTTEYAPPYGQLYPWIWKSKKFRLPIPGQFKAFKINFSVPPEITITPPTPASRNNDQSQIFNPLTQYLIVRVYADGREVVVREVIQDNEILKIPDGFKATYWEWQFEGQVNMYLFKASSSVKELKKA
jgi:hypothetical protein